MGTDHSNPAFEEHLYPNSIPQDAVNALPQAVFEETVVLVEDPGAVPELCHQIRQYKVLGFDTESRPSFKKGRKNSIALLQLAAPGIVWLFRLKRMGLPEELVRIFEDRTIKKVGVATRDDLVGLQEYRNFTPRGFIDLANYTDAFHIQDNGLRKIAAIILGVKISKSQQLSNWDQPVLTEKQIRYACIDAWACLEIYNHLNNNRIEGNKADHP